MTPQPVILMALLATTLITPMFAKPPGNSYVELLEKNYEFYMKTKNCEATRNFTINSYLNAISSEQSKEAERHSGYKGHFDYIISVLQTQLDSGEKVILLFLVTIYAICLLLVVTFLNWILDKLCPCQVEVTITSKQPHKIQRTRQVVLNFIHVANQQPEIHYYNLKNNDKTKTEDAPPAYENVNEK